MPLENSYLGQFTGTKAVRFQRIFHAPIEKVWQHLTDESLLPGWIADATVDLQVGGRIELRFREEDDPEGYCKGENISGGVILICREPELLSFVFDSPHAGETLLTYSLQSISAERTLFILDHSELPPELMLAFIAGWHSYIDALSSRLIGTDPQEFAPLFEEQIKRYGFVLAASSVLFSASAAAAELEPANYQAQVEERNRLLNKYDRLCHDEDELKRKIFDQKRSSSPDAPKELDYLVKDLEEKQDKLHGLELDISSLHKAMIVTN